MSTTAEHAGRAVQATILAAANDPRHSTRPADQGSHGLPDSSWATLLHLVSSRHGEVAIRFWRQIAKASSSNATPSRKVAGSSTASSSASGGRSAQGVPGDHSPGAAVLLEPAHRSQPRFEAAVASLDAVVGVLLSAMPGCWQQLVQHRRVGRRSVGDDPMGVILVQLRVSF
jgi:hypothetical protein